MKFKVDIGLKGGEVISFYDYSDNVENLIEKIHEGTTPFVSFYGAHDGVRRDNIVWYKTWRLENSWRRIMSRILYNIRDTLELTLRKMYGIICSTNK